MTILTHLSDRGTCSFCTLSSKAYSGIHSQKEWSLGIFWGSEGRGAALMCSLPSDRGMDSELFSSLLFLLEKGDGDKQFYFQFGNMRYEVPRRTVKEIGQSENLWLMMVLSLIVLFLLWCGAHLGQHVWPWLQTRTLTKTRALSLHVYCCQGTALPEAGERVPGGDCLCLTSSASPLGPIGKPGTLLGPCTDSPCGLGRLLKWPAVDSGRTEPRRDNLDFPRDFI